MSPDISPAYFVNLSNNYAFKSYCHQKSGEVFEAAIQQEHYPSRFYLLFVGLYATAAAPFYIAKKILEIILNVWNLSNLKDSEGDSFHADRLPAIIELATVQLTLPIACTAIRICSSVLGLLIPKLALAGWKIAEAGEELSYDLWAGQQMDTPCEEAEREVCEEIRPENAIFILGTEETRQILELEPEAYEKIEEEITDHFTLLLENILSKNRECFMQLLDYETALQAPMLVPKERKPYILDPHAKEILELLRDLMCTKDKDENSDRVVINPPQLKKDKPLSEELDQPSTEDIIARLTVEQMDSLFVHIRLNLYDDLLCDDLALDRSFIDEKFTHLSDLFSLRFKFGRAHFLHSNCLLYIKP